MPKYKKDETGFSLAITKDPQRYMITLPKVLMERLNTFGDRISLECTLSNREFSMRITGWKIHETGTFRCPDCGTVESFEGDMPQPLDYYALGDEIPVSCHECGRETTILKDWSA